MSSTWGSHFLWRLWTIPSRDFGRREILCNFRRRVQFLSEHIYQSTKIGIKEKFIHFKALFERQFETVITKLYMNNGGECVVLSGYLRKNGIVWESTALYMPQQNCISERTNRTLRNMVRSVLNESGLQHEFWAEAVMTPSSLRNMTEKRKLDMRTTIEAITENSPNVQHLRIFGCHVWYINRIKNRLESRGREGLLLRCLSHSLYQIINLQSRTILTMRHVSFDENKFPGRR